MIDQVRRNLLTVFTTGGLGVLSGCADLNGSEIGNGPGSVTLCRLYGLSRVPSPHEVTLIVRDGDETVIRETKQLEPQEGVNEFSVNNMLPITSSREPFQITAETGDRSETFEAETADFSSLSVFVELDVIEGQEDIGIYYREGSC